MNKLYLILLSPDIDREALTKLFHASPIAINFWFYNMPSFIFVKSTWSISQLVALIQNKFGKAPPLFIVELNSQTHYFGWIDKDHHKYFSGYLPRV
jgi:hypothetical protein